MSVGAIDMEALERQFAAARAAMPSLIRDAHAFSSGHRDAVESASLCGCFHCLSTFKPSEIHRWVDYKATPLCPRCGIDSVLPDNVGVSLDREFLAQMQFHWFGSSQCPPNS
jgi:hypothetical protein